MDDQHTPDAAGGAAGPVGGAGAVGVAETVEAVGSGHAGALIAQATGLLVEAGGVRGWSASDDEVLAAVRAAHAAQAVLAGVWLALLRQLQARPGAVPGAAGGKAAATFLVHALNVNRAQANRDVATAAATDPDGDHLPRLGAALAAGEISAEHARVAAAAVAKLPAAVKRHVDQDGRTGLQRLDAFLLRYCREHPPSTIAVLGRELLALVDPDRATDLTGDAHRRRSGGYHTDFLGMTHVNFVLDPADAVEVIAALERYAAPRPAGTAVDEHGQPVEVVDERTRAQRLADGLLALVRAADHTARHLPTPDQPAPDTEPEPEAGPEPGDPQAGP